MTTFYKTAETYKLGSKTLSQKYYTDNKIFQQEFNKIFSKSWLCCGRSNEILLRGSFITKDIGNDSILILRDNDNKIRAFHNICRHRGTLICKSTQGTFSKTIQCPYHGWTYDLNGHLSGAPNMNEISNFNKSDYPLYPIEVKDWGGFIFINLSNKKSNFNQYFSSIQSKLSEWGIDGLITCEEKSYTVNSNWKLIVQNYSECYHCPIIHPKLSDITHYKGGRNDLTSGPILGGYMEMNQNSITNNGELSGPYIGQLSEDNKNKVYYYSIFPNMLLSLHPDYIMVHTVWPNDIDKCEIKCKWLFSKEVKRSHYNPNNAIEFWDKTNQEDWKICEQSQLGINSNSYKPGPYSAQESLLAAFDKYYLSILDSN